MNLTDVFNDPPRPHEGIVMGLTEAAVSFIYNNVDDNCRTLETGCGLSTVAFALRGSHHTVIAPAPSEFEAIKKYCRDRDIQTSKIDFIAEPSQKALPSLEPTSLDLVLIDGGHGFPTPYIDWFYTAGRLEKDGYLVLDDVWLWSCQILRDFLLEQPQWRFIEEYRHRTAVFQKLEDGSEWLEWTEQALPARGGKMKWIDGKVVYRDPETSTLAAAKRALGDLKDGNLRVLGEKILRRVSGSG